MAAVQDDEFKKVDEVFNRIVSRKLDTTTSSRWTTVFVLLVVMVLVVSATVYYLYRQRKGKKGDKLVIGPVAEPVPKV